MKKVFSVLLVLTLLALSAGVAIAVWEDTKSTQITVNLLPLPEGTFRIVSAYCGDAAVGYDEYCHAWIRNESSTIMTIDVFTVATDYPHVAAPGRVDVNVIVNPTEDGPIYWGYSSSPEAEPGEVIFDLEVTCVGE